MSRTVRSLTVAAAAAVLLSGCAAGAGGGVGDDLGSKENPVDLGVVGASEEYWTTYVEAAAAEGITVELHDFTEYSNVNPALSEGELDINQFQHIQYLADYNVKAGDDLQPIGATAIYPLGLYSTKYASVDEIPEGETVIVPNDTVNQARGLLVLQEAGLVELKDGGNAASTLEDVEESSTVQVEAVDAALTVTSLPDVAAAIINNDFLNEAGLTSTDAIATDDPESEAALPYVNIFVTRDEDKENEVLARLVELYQGDQAVLDGVQAEAGGTAVFLQTPASELQQSLTDTEAAIGG